MSLPDWQILAGGAGAILGVLGAILGLWKALVEPRAAPPAARALEPAPPRPASVPASVPLPGSPAGIAIGTLHTAGGDVAVGGNLTDQRGPGSPASQSGGAAFSGPTTVHGPVAGRDANG